MTLLGVLRGLQLRGRLQALAVRRALLAGDVLLAQGSARGLGAIGLTAGELGHRGDTLAERGALLAGHVLLALALALHAIGLRLGGRTRVRSRRALPHRGVIARSRMIAAGAADRRVTDRKAGTDE